MKIRVVLDKVRVKDSFDPAFEGVDAAAIDVEVRTDNGGGVEQRSRLPSGRESFRPVSLWSTVTDEPVFEAEVEDHLNVRIELVDVDAPDSAEPIDTYSREFSADPEGWLGRYAPKQEAGSERGPEDLGFWEVYYHIERAEPE